MTVDLPALVSLRIDPRARLVLFDIADDPTYAAMEVQVFDDREQGRGLLVLLAHHDATVDVYHTPGLRIPREAFSVGRGLREWRTADIDPARVEVHADGIVVDVGLEDVRGQRIAVHIDDRDGRPRRHATLLAPVSSGVEDPRQLLVVLLREFDLVRTSGSEPRLTIGGARRRFATFPGPAWLHHRRFMRYSGAPIIVRVSPSHDGPVDPASLGPVDHAAASIDGASAMLRFVPPIPALPGLGDGERADGRWWLDIADATPVFGGTWSAARTGASARVQMAVTEPWRPRGLPRSLRLVTTVARVFRTWPTTYRWTAEVDLAASPPTARTSWMRTAAPDRSNAYGVGGRRARRLVAAGSLATMVAAGALVARRWRNERP